MDKLVPGLYYHIYNHANGADQLFRTHENYRFFLQQYAKHIYPVADMMPNHFHLLVSIQDVEELLKVFPKFKHLLTPNLLGFENLKGLISQNLDGVISQQFSNFFNSYSKAFNKLYNRRGSLFIKNFKRKVVSDDAYYTKLIHYIHANPVHHGFTKAICDWPWSSYHVFLSRKASKINSSAVLQWFGGMEAFMEFHQQHVVLKYVDFME